jgi:membrane protein
MLLAAGATLTLTVAFIALVRWLSAAFGPLPRFTDTTGWLLAPPVSFMLASLTFASLFRFLPPVPLTWRHVWLAAVLCGLAWTIGAELLALYAWFGDGTPYGAIGGLLVVMLWMNFVSQVLFYGAEICKVVANPSLRT